jgi:hypothetical protein
MKKKSYIILLLFIIVISLLSYRRFISNPQLNTIQITEMSETDSDVGSNYGLKIGLAILGWSIRGNSSEIRDGYIYMADARPYAGSFPLWEFALSQKKHLSDVTRNDLRCDFYGKKRSKGNKCFWDKLGW